MSKVGTLHDENPGLGGYHYDNVYNKLYRDLEKKLQEIKRKSIYKVKNLH